MTTIEKRRSAALASTVELRAFTAEGLSVRSGPSGTDTIELFRPALHVESAI